MSTRSLQVVLGELDADDPADTCKWINPLFGFSLPAHLTGSPSRNPPARVFPLAVADTPAPIATLRGTLKPSAAGAAPAGERVSSSTLSTADLEKARAEYEAAGAASGLPPSDDVWASLRDPLKGAKLTTKKRRLKTVPNCMSGKDAVDWFLARYPKVSGGGGVRGRRRLV